MDIKKRAAFLIILYNLMIFKYFNRNYQDKIYYNSNYVTDSSLPFAKLNDQNIYICGDVTNLSSDYDEEKDILIEDLRDCPDPNMRVLNSHKITSLKQIKNILEIMKAYEKLNPSDWNRTIISMEYEWYMHNLAYKFNLFTQHTADVDLNNNDEMKLIFESFSGSDKLKRK